MPSGEAQPCQMDMRPLTCCVHCCVVNVFVIFLHPQKTLFPGTCQKEFRAPARGFFLRRAILRRPYFAAQISVFFL